MEQELPADTVITLEISNQEIPCLFSQLIQNGTVLELPEVHQHQDIPKIEQDTMLNLVVQPTLQNTAPSDPNVPMTHNHTLAPLAERASQLEQAMIQGPNQVIF